MTVRRMSIKTYRELIKEGVIGEDQEKVFEYIYKNENQTDREITQGMGLIIPNQNRPRRRELVLFGLVEETDRRPCGVTGRTASQWRVVKDVTIKDVKVLKEQFKKSRKKDTKKIGVALSDAVKNQQW